FNGDQSLIRLVRAEEGRFETDALQLTGVTLNEIAPGAVRALADAQPTTQKPVQVGHETERVIDTSLTPELLLARVLTPERMSMLNRRRYIDSLNDNNLAHDTQVVAMWPKMIYPFTLLIMIAIAAPISLMQSRRGGVGSKVFAGILAGVGF